MYFFFRIKKRQLCFSIWKIFLDSKYIMYIKIREILFLVFITLTICFQQDFQDVIRIQEKSECILHVFSIFSFLWLLSFLMIGISCTEEIIFFLIMMNYFKITPPHLRILCKIKQFSKVHASFVYVWVKKGLIYLSALSNMEIMGV